MKFIFRLRECVRVVAILLLVLAGPVFGSAQEQRQKQQRTSAPPDVPVASQQLTCDLTRDNLDFVAASALQLKAVLVRDTGLMVELKRLIAKEASNNGQVIAEQDLTDAAVYERLANDVKFRSIATRLVQKYGYLRPMVNPESDMAKEQDLVLKERARKLVQIEGQEDQAALQLQTTAKRSQQNAPCRMGSYDENNPEGSECSDLENLPSNLDRNIPRTNFPRNDEQLSPPEQRMPSNPSSPILRARSEGSDSITGGLSGGLGENSSSYDALQNLLLSSGTTKSGTDSLVAGSFTPEQLELAALYSNRSNSPQGSGLPNVDSMQDGLWGD